MHTAGQKNVFEVSLPLSRSAIKFWSKKKCQSLADRFWHFFCGIFRLLKEWHFLMKITPVFFISKKLHFSGKKWHYLGKNCHYSGTNVTSVAPITTSLIMQTTTHNHKILTGLMYMCNLWPLDDCSFHMQWITTTSTWMSTWWICTISWMTTTTWIWPMFRISPPLSERAPRAACQPPPELLAKFEFVGCNE